ncbi:putative aldouronate transport system substrate-binding protein [Paenibacillus catalpae]|uniref:Putative aldouronate transport system substrate-binding protein n=1 Tax=Paenibacillus catalpae TaxID=1045775 RepID=A0A1I1SRF9_9BACL|nr:extracellular solute-binding protein [Paenibacillus catalpae]SFD48931.1 putative aldouronate transport system substrate-binding protein [Paenibacillus catalpae]
MNMRLRNTAVMLTVCLALASGCASNDGGSNNGTNTANSSNAGNTNKQETPSEPADPFGKYAEPVTITIGKWIDPAAEKTLPAGDTVENNQYTRFTEEKLNIKFDHVWQAQGDAYKQKLKLAIASNDIPDAMVVEYSDLVKLVEAGQLQDMTDVYKNYASPQIKEIYDSADGIGLEQATFDGKLMAIPNSQTLADSIYLMWIRQDWLDKLGLQPPKTVDDIAAVAKAFIDKDASGKGTAGLTGSKPLFEMNNSMGGLDPIFAAFHSYPLNWLKDSSGNIVFGGITQETKEALGKLRDMYAQGLIDKEFALRSDNLELVKAGTSGIFFAPWWMGYYPLPDSMKNDPAANWKPYLVPLDSEGKFNTHVQSPTSAFFVMKKGYKHPEALMKYINLQVAAETYADQEAVKLDPGVGLQNWPMRSATTYADNVERNSKAINDVISGAADVSTLNSSQKPLYEDWLRTKDNPEIDFGKWGPAFSYIVSGQELFKPMNKVFSLYYGQTKTMETKWANLLKMQNEAYTKIIMGSSDLDSFDDFVKNFKAQGGNEITKEVTEALNE